jgi:transcriptional regulator with XRE-family HTH domain
LSDGEPESTTVLRREIGRRFVVLRKATGLTLDQASKAWKKSRSTLQRLENGVDTVRFLDRDVAALLDVYGASDEDRKLLMGMTETAEQTTSWWHDFDGSAIPKWFRLYVGLEDAAATIRQYDTELVPGLLQTRDYAEQVIRSPVGVQDDEEVRRRATVRVERQSLLTRFGAPDLTVVLNEAVLRRVVGNRVIMADQLRHLVKASEAPNIHVRVLPFSAGLHAGAMGGAFSFLEFLAGRNGEPTEKPNVYLEAVTGAMYLRKPHEIAAYNIVWQDLMEKSLDEQQSRDMIIRTAEEYSRG